MKPKTPWKFLLDAMGAQIVDRDGRHVCDVFDYQGTEDPEVVAKQICDAVNQVAQAKQKPKKGQNNEGTES